MADRVVCVKSFADVPTIHLDRAPTSYPQVGCVYTVLSVEQQDFPYGHIWGYRLAELEPFVFWYTEHFRPAADDLEEPKKLTEDVPKELEPA